MARPSTLLSLAVCTVFVLVWTKRKFSKRKPPFPPGPPGEPIIGNLRSMPSEDEAIFFHNLGKKY
ncbi:hypothetical protein H0H87_005766, partial [Tephrocybe sp. NHM501043]